MKELAINEIEQVSGGDGSGPVFWYPTTTQPAQPTSGGVVAYSSADYSSSDGTGASGGFGGGGMFA